MKKFNIAMMIVLLLAVNAMPAQTGRAIMDKAYALKRPDTVKAVVTMLVVRSDATAEKEFELIGKKSGDNDKALVTFTKPTKIKFLTHTHKKGDDDQWLMMTSGKVKRIAAGERSQSFVNSHLSYEDMKSRDIDAYSYTLIGEAKAVGTDCYTVEARPAGKESVYSKAVFYVRKSDYFIVRIDMYKGDTMLKYMECYDVKNISGILTPAKAVMYMADGSGRTELIMKSVEYNKNVPDSALNKDALR